MRYGKMYRFDLSTIHTVLFAGEVFPIDALKQLKSIWRQADFYNLYGPTETNVCTWYKTGDLVEVDNDLNFVYSGRKDRMVKKRGYRVELGEIESILHKHRHLEEVGVISHINDQNEVEIVAFLKNTPGSPAIPETELKQLCLDFLPQYMLPDTLMFIENFPQTSTQKIDYQKLTRLFAREDSNKP